MNQINHNYYSTFQSAAHQIKRGQTVCSSSRTFPTNTSVGSNQACFHLDLSRLGVVSFLASRPQCIISWRQNKQNGNTNLMFREKYEISYSMLLSVRIKEYSLFSWNSSFNTDLLLPPMPLIKIIMTILLNQDHQNTSEYRAHFPWD